MTPLTIHEWDNTERQFDFVGWHSNRAAILVGDEKRQRQLIRPILPCSAGAEYVRNPFEHSPRPVRIQATRLLPPDCYASEAAAREDLLSDWPKKGLEEWPRPNPRPDESSLSAWTRPDGRALWPLPKHESQLRKKLRGGRHENADSLRDAFLQELWAKRHGLDLGHMRAEHAACDAFLREFTFIPDLPPQLARNHSCDPAVCASVRYAIHFEFGPARWLTGYRIAPPVDADEHREFEQCLSEPGNRAEASSNCNWHNPDYTIVFIRKKHQTKITPMPIPVIVSELLRMLDEAPEKCLKRRNLIELVSANRNTTDYRPEKILESDAGKSLTKAGLIHQTKEGKELVFWLTPPG